MNPTPDSTAVRVALWTVAPPFVGRDEPQADFIFIEDLVAEHHLSASEGLPLRGPRMATNIARRY